MTEENIRKILEIGISLSSEKDFNRLLEKILIRVMELTNCDAGTLYLRSEDTLRFKIMRNNTLRIFMGGDGREPDLPPVKLSGENVCAKALLDGRTIRIKDVRTEPDHDFSGPARYDSITGYHTQSMLVVPMKDRADESIGVLQLLNAVGKDGQICEFSEDVVMAVESVASQAAIAIQNMNYLQDIKGLLNSFVSVMSSAIDERTPYNGTHAKHMSEYGERFIDYINRESLENGGEEVFSSARREELLMTIWLHDIGKLVTPVEIMNKNTRLTKEQRIELLHRLEDIRLLAKIETLEGKCTRDDYQETVKRTREVEKLAAEADTAECVDDELTERLDKAKELFYIDENNEKRPWITEEEYQLLTIRKGTLSPEERAVMQDHVVITDKLLSQIKFTKDLSHVREWAASHHERLDGSGYPKGLKGDQVPYEVRILAILDIFDALVAKDRPYKKGMPAEKAIVILTEMADIEGKLDAGLVRQFIESRCWEDHPKQ
ncbi:MAG TPA: GAF domain-containing protein [Candidatus Lachnoclostridium stercoravium]|uniref:GAF domain-containing protein n=1 Tax=Candidatus Lachnoclostridium stercoravium TaxID=2838633 RepID=A0A9D2KM42_9FIRM|nr:GAF domain-containing protein [Candidatus Lachnoclostridium stercoravium]